MQEAHDFAEEAQVLADLLAPLDGSDFDQPTLFKGWTIDDVLGHLHLFDVAVLTSLQSDAAFAAFIAPIQEGMRAGQTLRSLQYPWLNGLKHRELYEAWRETAAETAAAFAQEDPKRRLKWVGPDMSARSSITARQMETWAHGHEVFDALGQARPEADRIRNIAHLGVATFGWTHLNRGLSVPDPAPYVALTGPSGALWTWGQAQSDNCVTGSAVEFSQVVTQTRNVADTTLDLTGPVAQSWMAMAQCFAGPPEDPPGPDTRTIHRS